MRKLLASMILLLVPIAYAQSYTSTRETYDRCCEDAACLTASNHQNIPEAAQTCINKTLADGKARYIQGARYKIQRTGLIVQSGGRVPTSGGGGTVLPNFPYDETRSVSSNALYVASSGGSDANNCTSSGTACATLSGAVGKLGALNTSSTRTIYLLGGTHSISSSVTMSTGSSSSWIEVTSYPGTTPVIDFSGGAVGTKFIVVDGVAYLKFSHLRWTHWGYYGFMVGENTTSTHDITWYSNDAYMNRCASVSDNSGFIFFYDQGDVPNVTIDRIRVRNTTGSACGSTNDAAIYWKRTKPAAALINHFDLQSFPSGIYHKHGDKNATDAPGIATAQNGIITGVTRMPVGYNAAGWLYQHVVFAGTYVRLADDDGGVAGDNNAFVHCTIYDAIELRNQTTTGDTQPGAQNVRFTNSIVRTQLSVETNSTVTSSSDYNLFSTGASAIVRYGSNNTLSQWQSNNSSDAHSIQNTPSFTGGADATLPSYYQLQNGSPGKAAASDGKDMGADTTLIGPQAAWNMPAANDADFTGVLAA